VGLETEQLAWLLLRAVDRTQTKGSTARLAVPSDPEVLARLASVPVAVAEGEVLLAEEYLEGHGHLAPADITLSRGTYTITPAGLRWLEGGPPQQSEAAGAIAEGPGMAQPRPAAGGTREGARRRRRRWWRIFGG
jgi:hypothetical protein